MSARLPQRAVPWAMVGVVLLAFALRLAHLDFQSLWSDEGISLLRSSQPVAVMLRDMPVEHMPGYFLGLHTWLGLAGTSDFALRFPSVIGSVLAVALAYRLGTDLGSRGAALVAALLLATNAFQVWYAQEARMYSSLLATGLCSSWLLWQLLAGPGGRRWWVVLGYALSTAAAIYLHFYGLLVPIAHGVLAVGWLVTTRNWGRFGRWALGAALAALLFLPWLPRSLGIFQFSGWREATDPWQIPQRFLTAYMAGETMPAPWQAWLPTLALGLALLGVVVWWRIGPGAALFLLGLTLVPWGVTLLLALRNPDFHERYAIIISGGLQLLVAGGVVGCDLRRWGAGARRGMRPAWLVAPALLVMAGLVFLNLLALQRLYEDTSFHKPDFRGAARQIEAQERPGDVILVDGPDPEKVFLHYYAGEAPVFDLRSLNGSGDQAVDAALAEMTVGGRRAWEVLYFHPPGPVQVWLATRAWATTAADHNGIRVSLYGLPATGAAGAPAGKALDVDFGPALTLARAELGDGPLRTGDILQVTTHWQVAQQAGDYKFSLRLADPSGRVWLTSDYVPQNWFAPTTAWVVGQPAEDRRGLLLPADLPAGTYQVTLRLYDAATGVPVDTVAGQDIALGEIEVVP